MAKQIIASCDPLYGFKYDIQERYPDCSIFEHDVNQTVDLGCGEYKGNLVREKIITDGKISLHKRNLYQPNIVWQNVLVTLENGTSISIDISDATFMVDVIRFGEKRENEIHIVEEDRDSLQTILNFLYYKQPIANVSTISFKTPSLLVLESIVNGKTLEEELDFNNGTVKEKKKRH